MDTRILNLRFVDPPSTKLPTAAALSALEVPVDRDLFVVTGDISNAFYNTRVPDDLSDVFSMPTIRALSWGDRARGSSDPSRLDPYALHVRATHGLVLEPALLSASCQEGSRASPGSKPRH